MWRSIGVASRPHLRQLHHIPSFCRIANQTPTQAVRYCQRHALQRSLSSLSARRSDKPSEEPSEQSYIDGKPVPVLGNDIHALISRIRPHLFLALARAQVKLDGSNEYMDVAEIDVACASVLDLVRMQKRSITSDELVRLTVKRIEQQIQDAREAAAVVDELATQRSNAQGQGAVIQVAQRLHAEYSEPSENDTQPPEPKRRQVDNPFQSFLTTQPSARTVEETIASTQPTSSSTRPNNSTFRLYSEQLALERIALEDAVAGYASTTRQLVHMQKGAQLRPAQKMMIEWYSPLVAAIEAERKKAQVYADSQGSPKTPISSEYAYMPLLLSLGAPELAVLTMHTMFSLALSGDNQFNGVRFSRAAGAVGNAVNMEVKMETLKKDKSKMRQFFSSIISDDRSSSVLNKLRGSRVERWGADLSIKLGAALLQLLLKTAMVPNSKQFAFKHDLFWDHTSTSGPRLVGLILTDERVLNTVLRDSDVTEAMAPKLKPMLVKPRPWQGFDAGGYLSVQNRMIRTSGSGKLHQVIAHADLNEVCSGLNYLGSIPWRVNKNVLNIVEDLWTSGGGYGDLPTKTDIPIPVLPPFPQDETDPVERKKAKARIALAHRHNRNLHSLRCDTELKLNVARQFRDRTFYFPFSLDFRGRAYPIPPHLNHLGNDLSRGLLTFDECKPLGEEGLRWLRVHITNLWGQGYDKLSFDDRITWADQHMHLIRAAAKDPLNKAAMNSSAAGALPDVLKEAHMASLWWLQAEKPFQFLAACFELDAAYSLDDPTQYSCSLPVHQDGSCNGLQHYAALGRDVTGGMSVNLTPSDKPQDVYSVVCAEVNRRLTADAEANVNQYAQYLAGRIVRKIVKQTVMTSVYGVTIIGSRDQIKARLLERSDIPWPADSDVEDMCHRSAMYLATVTLDSLYSAFSGARRIQNWLTDAANLMSSIQQPVSWVTPLGLPVIQPYRQAGSHEIQTVLQNVTIASDSDSLPVSGARQRSAFPPNFIHSLDATHMLLTARRCSDAGLTFTAVHDSYWTHAGTMGQMNKFLREEFVHLYEQPILQRLHEDWQSRFPELEFPPVPETGTLDLKRTLESDYFFN